MSNPHEPSAPPEDFLLKGANRTIPFWSTIIHRGRHTAVGDVTVTDAAGNLVAKALTTYVITRTTRKPGSRASQRHKKES
jgi:hypothetical protein